MPKTTQTAEALFEDFLREVCEKFGLPGSPFHQSKALRDQINDRSSSPETALLLITTQEYAKEAANCTARQKLLALEDEDRLRAFHLAKSERANIKRTYERSNDNGATNEPKSSQFLLDHMDLDNASLTLRWVGYKLDELVDELTEGGLDWTCSYDETIVQLLIEGYGEVGASNVDLDALMDELWKRHPKGIPEHLQQGLLEARRRYLALSQLFSRSVFTEDVNNLDAFMPSLVPISLSDNDAFGARIMHDLRRVEAAELAGWKLLADASSKVKSKPSDKWLKTVGQAIDAIGKDTFVHRLHDWLPQVGKAFHYAYANSDGTMKLAIQQVIERIPNDDHAEWFANWRHEPADFTRLNIYNRNFLVTLIWACSVADDPRLIPLLRDLSDRCLAKVPGIGARCKPAATAIANALTRFSSDEAVGQVLRMQQKVKKDSARKSIDKAVERAAAARGVSPEDLADQGVPTFGLDADGLRTETLGECSAQLIITSPTTAELRWFNDKGKAVKSVPKAAKDADADGVKALKAAHKDIQQQLTAQRDRFEKLYRAPRQWTLADWRQRYIDHPLLRQIATRLIWRLTVGKAKPIEAGWLVDQFVDANDKPLANLTDDATIELWHPIDSNVKTVTAWRDWLNSHDITQPFKQAHREVYQLTDAERQTGTYSNRFAAHVLNYRQMLAIAEARNWKMDYAGAWDGGGDTPPTLDLPAFGLQASYWVEPASYDDHANVADLVTTDQVRFTPAGETDPIALDQVPPVAFSEVMRDIDLFTGVCSVANDPAWQDGGPDHRHRDYWQNVSFGQLTQFAQARKAALEAIIPRLKIAKKCAIKDRFLHVQGQLHSYKIHLGSANILITPDDRYLCIVPDRKQTAATGAIYLPFEGDAKLAEILAKAFMLAEDHKIKDPTIVSQLEG